MVRKVTDIDKMFGRHIDNVRREHKLTRRQISAKVTVSHQQIQKYETAENRITVSMLYEIAQALGVSIIDLIPHELRK